MLCGSGSTTLDILLKSFIQTYPKDQPRSILQAHLAGDESHRNAIDIKLKSAARNNYNSKNNYNKIQNDNNIKTTQNVNNKK